MAGDILSFIEKYVVEPFKYATSDWLKILIGVSLLFLYYVISLIVDGILSLFFGPFSLVFILLLNIIFTIPLAGYYIEVIRNTLKGLDTLPSWFNIVRILIDGLLYKIAYSIALFLYTLIFALPVILIGFILLTIFRDLSSSIPWIVLLSLFILGGLVIYMVVILIVFWICVPLATVNFAKKGFFGFFEVVDILKRFSLEYLVIWVLYKILPIIISLPIGICLAILMLIPFVNILVLLLVIPLVVIIGPVLGFILEVMFNRAVAKYYRERE
ncbi:DUF4013 domain-containing protein [Methanothermococcus sp. SCGC AD-155-E23]|nr:DUF4013 domain-containing protein [Methanothermococcus sp. SCGC AD-155-E23]